MSYPQQQPYNAPGQPPANNLVWGILVTIFCCLPFGIVSIVYAAQVNGKWQAGDVAGAQASAESAKKWAIWGAAVGAVVIVLYVIFVVLVGVGSMTSQTSEF